jgi:hypothetical protein
MSGTNGFNIGSDTTLSIISSGVPVAWAIITEFEPKQTTGDLDSTGLDGTNRYRYVEKGWEGTFGYDRQDGSIDSYFAIKEAGRYAGIQPPVVTITETTTNVDGSISVYRYDGVTLKLDTAGSRKGDAKVEPKVSWKAGRRIQVA